MQPDLALLTALDALLEEGSVTGAAQRLHLSAPAMSRTLGRLRAMTGDRILVRTGRTMIPTPYAIAVREQVHQLVAQANAVLAPHRELDLTTLDRVFVLRCHDTITAAIAPTLVSRVQAHAPGVRLRFLAETAADTSDLRQGHVDLEIGATQPDQPEIRFETLGEARLVVALRPGHPLLGARWTVEDYAAAQHVIVSRRGRLRDPIDDALVGVGLRRQVVAAAPTSVVALQIVAATDTLTTIAEHGHEPVAAALGLRILPVPITLSPVPMICTWHQRYDDDPAHRWLREQVGQVTVAFRGADGSRAPSGRL